MKAIDLMYQETRGRVATPDGETDYFAIKATRGSATRRHIGTLFICNCSRLCDEKGNWRKRGGTWFHVRSQKKSSTTSCGLD